MGFRTEVHRVCVCVYLVLYSIDGGFGGYGGRIVLVTLTQLSLKLHRVLFRLLLQRHLIGDLERLAQRQDDLPCQLLKHRNDQRPVSMKIWTLPIYKCGH